MTDIQKKIVKITMDYVRLFPAEYNAVKKIVREKRANNKTKWAETKQDYIERGLFEVSDTHYSMLISLLEGAELGYFKSKQGGRWFAEQFKEFALYG